MNDWKPATIEEVNEIVARDLKACDAEQLATFKKYRVEPFRAAIKRYGDVESVSRSRSERGSGHLLERRGGWIQRFPNRL